MSVGYVVITPFFFPDTGNTIHHWREGREDGHALYDTNKSTIAGIFSSRITHRRSKRGRACKQSSNSLSTAFMITNNRVPEEKETRTEGEGNSH